MARKAHQRLSNGAQQKHGISALSQPWVVADPLVFVCHRVVTTAYLVRVDIG